MSQKETIERLREIIRSLENRKDLSLPLEPQNEAAKDIKGPFSLSSLSPSEKSFPVKRPESMYAVESRTIEQEEGYKIFKTSYLLTEALLPCDEAALFGLKSIWPGIKDPQHWLFMDLETTGLLGAGTLAFLLGFGRWLSEKFIVTQYLIQDRIQESAVLERILKDIEESGLDTLVTFNGTSFDLPLLNSRLILSCIDLGLSFQTHMDLLSAGRSLMSGFEEGFSLKKCVKTFCGIEREDDVPGRMIPALYFLYEREGDESILNPVIKHNCLDILDMAALSSRWGQIFSGNMDSVPLGMLPFLAYNAGKLHFRKKSFSLAEKCLNLAKNEDGALTAARRLLAACLRKEGKWDEAYPIWEELLKKGLGDFQDYLWLARYYELFRKDIGRSLDLVSKCIDKLDAKGQKIPPCLLARKRRLTRRLV